MHILVTIATRPNIVKVAALCKELRKRSDIDYTLVHTGQHYDDNMSSELIDDLNLHPPKINLGVFKGSIEEQQEELISKLSTIIEDIKPDFVLVVGDVNATLSCALAAKRMKVNLIHVEAGLRSFDDSMPEEINRINTDILSDLLFVSEKSGLVNLEKEDLDMNNVHFVGNIMIDTLVDKFGKGFSFKDYKYHSFEKRGILFTIHRPSNVDSKHQLIKIVDLIKVSLKFRSVCWPVHPRTKKKLDEYDLWIELKSLQSKFKLELIPPMNYTGFITKMRDSELVVTDSGGVQEESCYLGVPCLTLRDNTERPVTVEVGANRLVPKLDKQLYMDYLLELLKADQNTWECPPLWDGKTAKRIVDIICKNFKMNRKNGSSLLNFLV